jgi:hypothetical protein
MVCSEYAVEYKRYYLHEAEETIKNNLANEIKLNELRTNLVYQLYRMRNTLWPLLGQVRINWYI